MTLWLNFKMLSPTCSQSLTIQPTHLVPIQQPWKILLLHVWRCIPLQYSQRHEQIPTIQRKHRGSYWLITPVLSTFNFYTGQKRGQICSYYRYCYAVSKSNPEGHLATSTMLPGLQGPQTTQPPPYKRGPITVCYNDIITKENPNCHPPLIKDVSMEQFFSRYEMTIFSKL